MPTMKFTARIPARKFGFDSDRTVLGFEKSGLCAPCARTARIDGNHVFDPVLFEQLRLWWEWDDTRSPLCITGPTGCGKTSTVMQFLARVNCPVVTHTCRRRMDKHELLGSWTACQEGFRWVDGPVTSAWRHGCVVLINEFTAAPPEVWVSLNDVLEGDDIVNERTGEVIKRHENARVIITDNCPLGGGDGDAYLERHVQDSSVIDRCWHIRASYMSSEDEEKALLAMLRDDCAGFDDLFVKRFIKTCVRFAQLTRDETSGPEADPGNVRALSTRVLLRFARVLLRLAKGDRRIDCNRLAFALGMSIANGCPPKQSHELLHMAHLEFAPMMMEIDKGFAFAKKS